MTEIFAKPISALVPHKEYDPFMGSGTTLIAAERLKRLCFGMEISENFCDVILARWEAETTQSAVLLSRVPEK
jgi:DNA modification methylase